MSDIKIVKRDNSVQEYCFFKINAIIQRANADLNINPKPLTDALNEFIKDGISTVDIYNYLTTTALNLTSLDEPNWKNFAGRLKIFALYKAVSLRRNVSVENLYSDYLSVVKTNIENGVYTTTLTDKYSSDEIRTAGHFIRPEFDLIYDYAGANLLLKRYLCELSDCAAELPQEMFLTIALLLEQDAPKEVRLQYVKDTYEKLADKKISLGTPFLMNLRRPEGNLSSCFITAMDDNRDSIFYVIDQISAISKFGGGVGVNVSRVRSKGARIKGIKNASGGVVPWIRIINDTAIAVNQQGKRKGAVTVSLDIWHADMEYFLELRTENGDQRMKAYDIFPQVVIPDLFMKKVEANDQWLMFDPNEIRTKYQIEIADLWGTKFENAYALIENDARAGRLEICKFVNAKELLKKIMKSQIETGMPYLAFKDTLNKYNPNKHDGVIVGTNLCTESHSNVRPSKFGKKRFEGDKIVSEISDGLVHVCNLVSLNLANIETNEELKSVCNTSVRILDNAIDFTQVPILEGSAHNNRYRTIGIGAMGLADYLAKRNLNYTASAEIVDDLFERIALYNIAASIDLAKHKTAFPAYNGSDWSLGIILGKQQSEFQSSKYANLWNDVFENLKKYGIRNSQISAIAPNTSSSLIQGCSASVLPIYSKFFVETHGKGSIPNCPPFIREKFWFYQENRNIPQTVVVDIMARINKWVDTGISIELMYNLNNNIRATDIYQTIMAAWKSELKTLYYTRTIQKDGSSIEKQECVSCAG